MYMNAERDASGVDDLKMNCNIESANNNWSKTFSSFNRRCKEIVTVLQVLNETSRTYT